MLAKSSLTSPGAGTTPLIPSPMNTVVDYFALRGDDVLVNARYLKSRGWTAGMIRQLLPPPSHRERNPHVPIAAGQRLWAKEHVEEIEAGEHFERTRARAQERSQQAISKRRELAEALVIFARSIQIDVPNISVNQLIEIGERRFDSEQVCMTDGAGHTFGWQIGAREYLLEAVSTADYSLDECYGKCGVCRARGVLQERKLLALAERFPELF